jgi:Tfp pilus assembly protein PilX
MIEIVGMVLAIVFAALVLVLLIFAAGYQPQGLTGRERHELDEELDAMEAEAALAKARRTE